MDYLLIEAEWIVACEEAKIRIEQLAGVTRRVLMPLSPERQAAHDQLDAAVNEMIRVYDTFDEGQFLLGYTLIVGGTRMMNPELDEEMWEDGDESEFVTTHRAFTKRGQQPAVSRGLLEFFRDRQR